jgi:hypothetical protein
MMIVVQIMVRKAKMGRKVKKATNQFVREAIGSMMCFDPKIKFNILGFLKILMMMIDD